MRKSCSMALVLFTAATALATATQTDADYAKATMSVEYNNAHENYDLKNNRYVAASDAYKEAGTAYALKKAGMTPMDQTTVEQHLSAADSYLSDARTDSDCGDDAYSWGTSHAVAGQDAYDLWMWQDAVDEFDLAAQSYMTASQCWADSAYNSENANAEAASAKTICDSYP